MTPEQFRYLREGRKLTREALGDILGVTASAIVQWERGTRAIPQHAAEKMLRTVDITLPIEDLGLLMDAAAAEKKDFSTYLAGIIRDHLAAKRAPEIGIHAATGTCNYIEKPIAASPALDVSRVADATDAGKK